MGSVSIKLRRILVAIISLAIIIYCVIAMYGMLRENGISQDYIVSTICIAYVLCWTIHECIGYLIKIYVDIKYEKEK